MNHLMKLGKNIMKKRTDDGDDDDGNTDNNASGGGSSSSKGFSNPMKILKKFDRDNDGSITENDFVLAVNDLGLGSIGEGAVRSLFKKIDKNKNGKLDMSEAFELVKVVKDLFMKKSKQNDAVDAPNE